MVVTTSLLDMLPTSRYRKNWPKYYPDEILDDDPVSKILKHRAKDTDGYSSDDTILYNWVSPINESISFKDATPTRLQGKKTKTPSKKITTFDINVIGLCHRKPRYWLKCKVSPSKSSFSTKVG